MSFQDAASKALSDSQLRRNLGNATRTIVAKRAFPRLEDARWAPVPEKSKTLSLSAGRRAGARRRWGRRRSAGAGRNPDIRAGGARREGRCDEPPGSACRCGVCELTFPAGTLATKSMPVKARLGIPRSTSRAARRS